MTVVWCVYPDCSRPH